MTTIADLLRREIHDSGRPLLAIAREIGLTQQSLWRFVHERVDPKLDSAERLLRHFGYQVVKTSGTVQLPPRGKSAGPRRRAKRRTRRGQV